MPPDRVAVVGAGAAGCGAAWSLREAPGDVTVFEARDRPGGRLRTGRRDGCVYDYGANYVKPGDDRVTDLLTGPLSDGLVTVDGRVWTFDGDGDVAPGREPERTWSYRSGIATLADRLLDGAEATVRTGARVTALDSDGDRWRLRGVDDTADAVVLAVPPHAVADLLDGADWGDADEARADLAAAADAAPYRTIVTAVLGYERPLDRPWYGLVNVDREHQIGWLSRESRKPGHVPAGEEALVVQLSPAASRRRFEDPDEDVADTAAELVADLLDDGALADPAWTAVHRFEHALPDAAVDSELVERAAEVGVHLAGDWTAGEGRVHLAVASGLDAADAVLDG